MLIHTVKWISKINWGKVIITGLIYTITAVIIHQIEAIFTLKYYMMPQYFGVWSTIMMPKAGPPPMDFFIKSMIFTLVSGVCLSLVYYYIRDMLPNRFRERVLLFADLLIGLQFVFFTMPTFLLFNVPAGLLVSWFISSFIILVITSYACVKIIK